VEVFNDSLLAASLTDVAIVYREPERRWTIKSIILSEERAYPVPLQPRERFRIHLLPSLIDLPRIDYISVNLSSNREFRLKTKTAAPVP